MSNEIVSALIQTGGTLVGVGIGFLLSYWQIRRKDKQAERNIYLLLKREVSTNYQAIHKYIHMIAGELSLEENGKNVARRGNQKYPPFPTLNRQVFELLLPSIPAVLSEEQMRNVLTFYDQIDELIINKSAAMKEVLHPEVEKIATEVLAAGNPLEK